MRPTFAELCSLCWLVALAGIGVDAVQAQSRGEFAPGVVTTIPVDFQPEETVSTHDVVEIRANPAARWEPELETVSRTLYGMSQGVKFRRDVSCLEFSFKPLRMIRVGGKLVWYLVYSVRNTGEARTPVEQEGGTYTAGVAKGGPVRFIPSFVLESHDLSAAGERINKAYLDRIIPGAMAAIRAREARDHTLLNSVEMAEQVLPPSDGRTDNRVWGVATWTDVDPRIDFFSVYVGGLSNAYRWEDPAGVYQAGDPPGTGRQFVRKTLQLNFWRPGDEHYQDEREIRFGVARGKGNLYDVTEGVAYRWVYR
jgi:hypothetical protein